MEILLESMREDVRTLLQMAPRLFVGLVLLLIALAVGRVLGRGLAGLARRSRANAQADLVRQLTVWTVGLLGLTLALQLAGLGRIAAGMLAAGGLAAVVFGFAFRSIGENLLAGFFLSFSRSFEVGDLIQCGEWMGAVRAIELRYVHVRTADGRDIFLPCSAIYGTPLVNFTKDGLRRPSFTVGIDYADDAREACRLLLQATREAPGVLAEPPPNAVVSALAAACVELQVTFWSDTFQQGLELVSVQSDVMERCRRALRDAGYTLSNDVTTALDVRAAPPLAVRMEAAS